MPTPYDPIQAHELLASVIYGDPSATNRTSAYLAAPDWASFFAIDPVNTKLFVAKYKFETTFEECEPFILQNLKAIVNYAHNGLKTRWEDGETALIDAMMIARDSEPYRLALIYANSLVKPGRWIEFETQLNVGSQAARLNKNENGKVIELINAYLAEVADIKDPALEEIMFLNSNPNIVIDYLINKNQVGPVTSFEATLYNRFNNLNADAMRAAIVYTIRIRQTRWTELEAALERQRSLSDIMYYKANMIPSDVIIEDLLGL